MAETERESAEMALACMRAALGVPPLRGSLFFRTCPRRSHGWISRESESELSLPRVDSRPRLQPNICGLERLLKKSGGASLADLSLLGRSKNKALRILPKLICHKKIS